MVPELSTLDKAYDFFIFIFFFASIALMALFIKT
jgi:hypothetical protein